ncbi:MAG: YjfB family protein [Lachnospiraceae bacterium]|nr:YjfB family protein [Lachnospiraceae bacterium]
MDIAQLSMSLAQSNVTSNFGVAMLSNSLDSMETAGAGVLKLMEAAPAPSAMELSVNPAVGGNFDMSV